jgi:hypothetical protein
MIFGIQPWFGFCQIGSSNEPDLLIAFGDKHIIIFPKTWLTIIHNQRLEFMLPFWKPWEDSDVMLANTQETSLIKKNQQYPHSSYNKLPHSSYNKPLEATTSFLRKAATSF